MFSNRTFQVMFLISAVIHGGLFVRAPLMNKLATFKPVTKIEVTYLKLKPKTIVKAKKEPPKRKIDLKSKHQDDAKKLYPPPAIKKEEVFKKKATTLTKKPRLLKPDVIEVKKTIQIKPQGANKINTPSYNNYYQLVREKIQRSVRENFTRTDSGNVHLTFVIFADGSLADVRVSREKSSANTYLEKIALRSVEIASPFPPFPQSLNYPQLSFNVIVSFVVE